MTRRIRRVLSACIVIAALGSGALPVIQAQGGTGSLTSISGSYTTTNPVYPLLGADTGVVLYDLAGVIQQDYAFVPPPEAQVLGQMDGDITSGTYQIDLPETPQGTMLDFDGDAATPPAVQVFAAATYINFLGDITISRGETPLGLSVRLASLSQDMIGGHLIVWAAQAGEWFPNGFGRDGALFTGDEPLTLLPAGWSVVSLKSDPFRIIHDDAPDIPITEASGALNDYSDLSYEDAWNRLFWRTAETYPFSAEKHLDWDLIYNEVTPLIQASTSPLEFHLAIARFGNAIPDTHISFASVPVMQQFLVGGVGISGLTVTDDGQVVITGVEQEAPAALAGIQAYDVLVAVDGTPALQVLDETPMLLTSASTPHGRRYFQAVTMLQGPVGSSVTLTWRSADGRETSRTLTRIFDVGSILQAFDGSFASTPVIDAHLLASGVGYITIRSFSKDVSQADALFTTQLQALMDAGASGIIIDVRDNTGGLITLGMSMIGHFFPDYQRVFDLYYANGRGEFVYRGFIEILANQPYYDGPVAVLIDEMTGSAGDMFAYTMDLSERVTVVGSTPSGGFAGEISDGQYALPGGLRVQIPTGRPVDPVTGETLIEGLGVAPDIRVPVTLDSLRSPEDEVLLAAEAALLAR